MAKFLQASASEVHGDPRVHPQREEYWGSVTPICFQSRKDEGKRCAETLFFDHYLQGYLRADVACILNAFGPLNLGNPDQSTIDRPAERVIVVTGSKSKLVYRPLSSDDPTQRQPDVLMTRDKLSRKLSVPFENGLAKTKGNFEKLLNQNTRVGWPGEV